ncbi:MurR/RpiR family transcriptional regulator HpxU [Myceligenerans cantabricum]
MPLETRVRERYADLSPQEARAADLLLERMSDLAAYRATELAELAGVSKATMSRLVRRLGYEDFEGLREHLREQRGRGLPVTVTPPAGLAARLQRETEHLQRAYAALDETAVEDAATALARARRVLVVGRRGSHPVAAELRRNLAQVRPGVMLAPSPGQSLAEDLVGVGREDVVVVVSFRRHPAGTAAAVERLVEAGVPVLLLADPTLRRLAAGVRWWIECPVGYEGAFDSHAVPMSLVATLSDLVLARTASGAARIAEVDAVYAELGELDEG